MLGSSRTIVQDGQTTPCYDADFYPFGGERVIANACPQNYKFEGKERDAETGNDDFGARYYSSRFGRWLSADWSSVPAPVPYANLTNPQTLNLYAMVSDNPETFADLDGHGQANEGSNTNTGCNYTSNKCDDDKSNHDQNAQMVQNQNQAQQPPTQQNNADNETVGKTTVGDLSKVLTNEIGSLGTPKGGNPSELEKGADALANALINNASKATPNKVAPDTGKASPQLAKSMQNAYTNRAKGGADPVHGRTYYGTSHTSPDKLNSRPIGNSRQTVYEHFGPFRDSTSPLTTYIYIYNDPGH